MKTQEYDSSCSSMANSKLWSPVKQRREYGRNDRNQFYNTYKELFSMHDKASFQNYSFVEPYGHLEPILQVV